MENIRGFEKKRLFLVLVSAFVFSGPYDTWGAEKSDVPGSCHDSFDIKSIAAFAGSAVDASFALANPWPFSPGKAIAHHFIDGFSDKNGSLDQTKSCVSDRAKLIKMVGLSAADAENPAILNALIQTEPSPIRQMPENAIKAVRLQSAVFPEGRTPEGLAAANQCDLSQLKGVWEEGKNTVVGLLTLNLTMNRLALQAAIDVWSSMHSPSFLDSMKHSSTGQITKSALSMGKGLGEEAALTRCLTARGLIAQACKLQGKLSFDIATMVIGPEAIVGGVGKAAGAMGIVARETAEAAVGTERILATDAAKLSESAGLKFVDEDIGGSIAKVAKDAGGNKFVFKHGVRTSMAPLEPSPAEAEIAAYQLDQVLGFKVVPKTQGATVGGIRGSIQEFIPGTVTQNAFEKGGSKLLVDRKIKILDLVTGNTDRGNGGNILVDSLKQRQYAIDNEKAFHGEGVIDEDFQNILKDRAKIRSLFPDQQSIDSLRSIRPEAIEQALHGLVTPAEISAVQERLRLLLQAASFQ